MTTIPFDLTDPATAILAWFLTWALGKLIDLFGHEDYRSGLPIAAIVLAAGIRAVIEVGMGEPFTEATVLRALAAGAVAVLSHSQLRELLKAGTPRGKVVPPADAETDPMHSER